jgi:serine/threonine-protein kinase
VTTSKRLQTGSELGAYRLESLLGSGGMGEVYRARDVRLGRSVAIKVLLPQISADFDARQRFEREARAIARLNHPNICTLHDIGSTDGIDYIVMEYLEGDTLAAFLATRRLPMDRVIAHGIAIASALGAAHKQSIVHRDLKPGNVILTKSGVKVLDFGVAEFLEAGAGVVNDETSAAAPVVLGTPAYMSPEQRAGKECDARTDIYALGLLLVEMATGRRRTSAFEPLPSDLPPQFAFVVERCLAPDPDDRWQSCVDIRLALECVALAGAQRATRSPELPLIRFSVDLGRNAVPGLRTTAALSPDARRLVFPERGADGKQRLATRLMAEAQTTLLKGTENAQDPFFSPDGKWLGFFADYRLKRVSVEGGAPVTVCEAPNFRGASWTDNDTIVLAPHMFGGLVRLRAAGGKPEPLTSLAETETAHAWPQVLPGGQAVLFTGGAPDAPNVQARSLVSGETKIVTAAGYRGRYVSCGHVVYVHKNALFAVPFDIDSLETRGVPVPIVDDIADDATDRTAHFDLANDGTLVYLSRDAVTTSNRTIALMDSSGHIVKLIETPGRYSYLFPSPDGRKLAFIFGQDVWVLDMKRGRPSRVSFNTIDNQWPVWAPDSAHLVFSAQNRKGTGRSLWWIRADGSEEPQLLFESDDELHPSSVSPDGTYVAVHRRSPETLYDIWMLPLDCTDPERPKAAPLEVFLRTPVNEWGAVFSPNGRWVAYYSDESGTGEIYVRPAGGRGGRWLVSSGGTSGTTPHWPSGGRALYYLSPDRHIMEVTYTEEGNSFVADEPQRWSEATLPSAAFNLSADCTRAIIAAPAEPLDARNTLHVTFLLNLFDELRRRAPVAGP